ncbi:hypothetical protein GOQ30_04240 [Flavobacterium sp. TP390]|uniref:Uncharacterized protein n=1 Tax=Flavobacterium profundi TaxID=1774945 RepID=A0A6I4IF78_9FLAO|nr:hypothetical protein [Flavobacterium profundi]MVO08373.1 hypothetical protein [Flavobacterium profundi]
MKPTYYLSIILFLAFWSCESRDESLKTNWKYQEGKHFGDFLHFENENIKIQGDTIFINSIPFAIIEEFDRTFFPGSENKLQLKTIETGEFGFYTDKGK